MRRSGPGCECGGHSGLCVQRGERIAVPGEQPLGSGAATDWGAAKAVEARGVPSERQVAEGNGPARPRTGKGVRRDTQITCRERVLFAAGEELDEEVEEVLRVRGAGAVEVRAAGEEGREEIEEVLGVDAPAEVEVGGAGSGKDE